MYFPPIEVSGEIRPPQLEVLGLGGGRAIRADGLVAVGYVYGHRDRNPADSLPESIESGNQ